MKYRTIVADPPWRYEGGFNGWGERRALPYKSMSLADMRALPVAALLENEGYLFLWTTSRHLESAFSIVRAWGCTPRQTLTWCKPADGRKGLGGMFATTTEFVIVGQKIREGTHAHGVRTHRRRVASSWFEWPRQGHPQGHSRKPEAFLDLVEHVAPGPYLELFARRRRLGWHAWGDEVDSDVELAA